MNSDFVMKKKKITDLNFKIYIFMEILQKVFESFYVIDDEMAIWNVHQQKKIIN